MVLPRSRTGTVATALGVLFVIMVTPPVIWLVNTPTLVAGVSVLYLWSVAWGIFVIAVLVWAARRDAYALTNDQVPPELRETEDVLTNQVGTDTGEDTARSSD